ncbi:MAG: VOC family protein [Acidobacteriia bacterium]|nr:VOC family protein [Terriglobia bacterium]
MIQRLSHVTIYVLDQEEAYDFYINKLGFEVRMDQKMDNGFRWLTIGPKGQPNLQIILMPTGPSPMMDQETSDALRALIRKGVLGAGVFQTANCQQTYEELKAKGVEFQQPPTERFYGIEALMKDNSGNWFSMSQPKEAYETPA